MKRVGGIILTLLYTLRPPFLLLAVACWAAGVATARHATGQWMRSHALVALLGALAAHAAVNLLNEWHDHQSGLDALARRTPFSGGSGALQKHPWHAPWVLGAALLMLGVLGLCGLFFLSRGLWIIVPLGLAGVLLIVAYTPLITHMPLLCLFAPGMAFGPLVMAGVAYVTAEQMRGAFWWTSLPVLFLCNNLLLLNQFPDVEADARSGRLTVPVVYGFRCAARVYHAFTSLAFGTLLLLVAARQLPLASVWAFLCLPLALRAGLAAGRFDGDHARLLPALRDNVLASLAVPLILAAALW